MSFQYQLDNTIDFHNSAEPSTTSCPLLPGQLVNVLHVPFHLSNGRSRNDSVSSTSSELWTMNPADKFMNPRPVPLPKLARLNTSPVLPQSDSPWSGSPWSVRSASSNRGASSPNSATSLRMFRMPRKMSTDGKGRSTSPANMATGLRAAFRQLASPRSASPDRDLGRGRSNQTEREMEISEPLLLGRLDSGRTAMPPSNKTSRNASREQSPAPIAELPASPVQMSQLALRRGLDQPTDYDEAFSAPSIQARRVQRQRSRSREPSSLRNSLNLSDECGVEKSLADLTSQRYQPLETLKESLSQQNTPVWPLTAMKLGDGTEQLPFGLTIDKRLPTLPNSPSSVYPPSASSDTPAKRLSDELKDLKSHFSEMTISTLSRSTQDPKDCSHFSEWTTTTMDFSPRSNYSAAFSPRGSHSINQEMTRTSLPASVNPREASSQSPISSSNHEDIFMSETETFPSVVSCSTISSCDSTTPSSPSHEVVGWDDDTPVDSKRSRWTSGGFQGYMLPEDGQTSESTLKCDEPLHPPHQLEYNAPRINVRRQDSVSHSTSMQQLMDELSYLGDAIQR